MTLPAPYYCEDGITIYCGDCREIMPEIAGAGLVVTDPPYSFGLASTGQEGKAGGWGDLMNNAHFYASILGEARRLISNRAGAAWVFNSWRSLPTLMRAAYEAQWPVASVLVWDKEWIGPGGSVGLRPSYELVALFAAEGFSLDNRGIPDIRRSRWHNGMRPGLHPAEKPTELIRWLIEESGGVGPVLDPFMGSGTTLVAAKQLGRKAVGIEIEERYCEVAVQRLAQGVLPLEAP